MGDKNDERQRENEQREVEDGQSCFERQWPCQCCMPLPFCIPMDMNEVNE